MSSSGVTYCLIALIAAVNGQRCATPDSKEGECVDLAKCQRLVSIQEEDTISVDDRKFYTRSRCPGNESKVCCQVSNKTVPFTFLPKPEAPVLLGERLGDGGLLPSDCGLQYLTEDRIVGSLTALGEFPWTVLLKYRSGNKEGFACGGALINKRYVVTAAHCVVGALGKPFEVVSGEYDFNTIKDCTFEYDDVGTCSDPVQVSKIEKYITHPLYSADVSGKPHDIALLRLEKPIIYTDWIQPICLGDRNLTEEAIKSAKLMAVAGWGETQNHGARNIKRKARVRVVKTEACAKTKTYPLTDSHLCAGGDDEDACAGDSGGPLMHPYSPDGVDVKWYMTGVVSIGPKICATKGSPGVYTRVDTHLGWIKNNMVA